MAAILKSSRLASFGKQFFSQILSANSAAIPSLTIRPSDMVGHLLCLESTNTRHVGVRARRAAEAEKKRSHLIW